MADSDFERLVEIVDEERFAKFATICHEGDKADRLFMLKAGTCAFYKRNVKDGAALRIMREPGDHFGESAFQQQRPDEARMEARRSASVKILQRTFLD